MITNRMIAWAGLTVVAMALIVTGQMEYLIGVAVLAWFSMDIDD